MKKINLIEWLSRNSHEKQSPQRFARYAAILIMLLTLGVGQMWAAQVTPEGKYFYFKTSSDWDSGARYAICFQYKNGGGLDESWYSCIQVHGESDIYYAVAPAEYWDMYFCRMNASKPTNSWTNDNGTGPYWNSTSKMQYDGINNYFVKSTGWNGDYTYNSIYVPKANSVALSYNVVPSSGAGTEGNPYIVPTGTTVRVTAAGTSELDDPDITKKYKWDSGSYGTTAYKDLNCSINNTTYSTTVSYKNYISSTASTNDKSATVYFKAVSDPTISLSSSLSAATKNTELTLTATPGNTDGTEMYQYYYKKGSGSWNTIGSSTSSATKSYTPTTAGTYTFKVVMSYKGSTYNAETSSVTIRETYTLKLKNSNGWVSHIHVWNTSDAGNPKETYPGEDLSVVGDPHGTWFTYIFDSKYNRCKVNSGDGNGVEFNVTADACMDIGWSGSAWTATSTSCPSAPSVSTGAASSLTNSSATFNASEVNDGNDNITAYGFKWGTTTACSNTQAASNLSGSTFSFNKTGLTAGTTYYFKAYVTTGYGGTVEGDRLSFVAPYKVTVSSSTGCSDITNSGTNYTNSTIEVIATKTTGYTFSSWTTTKGTQTSTSSTSTTNTLVFTPSADNATIQPVYTENMTTVNLIASPAGKGTFTSGGTVISVSAGVDTHPTVTAVPATGYRLTGTIWSESSDYISLSSTTTAATTITATGTTGNSANLTATFTPITYTVHFDGNGATSGEMSDQTGIAYDSETAITTNAFVKTGYTFAGWATTAEKAAAGTVDRTDGEAHGNLSSTQGATVDLYAVWTPKQSALSFDYQTSAEGHGADGIISAVSATYDAAMPSLTGTLPTAANGYAFMGFYDATGGEGTKYYNADGTSAATWDKDTENGTTLYAYYKKAEITALTLSDGTVESGGTITVTPTIDPMPAGTTEICWKLLYNNETEFSEQPAFNSAGGNAQSFTAPVASGTYKVKAQLHTGEGACGTGTLLSERVVSFVVASAHSVTIQYKCGDVTVKSSTVVEAKPLDWSEEITPDEIFGYSFEKWVAGDGVTMTIDGGETTIVTGGETTGKATSHAVQIKAIYDGKLIAKYTKKNIIYFKNTLGWTNVYYHDSYWDNGKGGAGNKGQSHINQAMSLVPGTTDIYYWEGTPSGTDVAFTDHTYLDDGVGYQAFWSKTFDANVVYPSNPTCASSDDADYGYNAGTPMFVPVEQDGQDFNENDYGKAIYYNKGYWRAYDPTTGESGSTGYTLKIYNKTEDSSRELLQSIPFTNADASGQIFKATAGLNAAGGYGIKVERDNSLMYTNTEGHLNRTGDVETLSVNPDNYAAIWIKSTAAGDYDFIITCDASGQLCLQATFPAAANDYRVLYTDNATWSNTAHTARTWVHPSRVISAEVGTTDTISFFVSKDNSPEYKIQRVSNINETTGAITWADVTSWTSISVAKTGVYNFIFNQPAAGSISLSKTEEYTGNFYIRTDNAGSTKWENYRTADHLMTYSEYAEKVSHADVSMDFTHYFMKFVNKDVESGKYKNVNFTIANDYSPCISDTLIQQAGDVSVTPSYTHVDENGDLQANANIRFMWNIKNNKLQRAYLAAAQSDGTKFLVLQGQSGMLLAPDETALSDDNGNNHGGGTDAIQFTDKEHWMYEAEVKAVPGGRVKLYATYNSSTFYYYGDNTASFDGTSAIDLVTGDDDEAQTIRVVYDFKTDRLMAAWVPSEETIENEKTINADIMLIREHQGQGHQINLGSTGSIKTNKTVYGVLRFNRWTLNNKSTTNTGTTESPVHAVLPVDEQKSQYERFNYMISFPFDVKVGEIFGFGTIGRHYRIYYYDGLGRAKEGFFAERGDDNWRMIDDTDSILHANQGYLLQLNYIRMADDNTATWPQKNMNEVELYFPAMNTINTISLADVTIPALGDAYKCKINLQPTYEAQGNPKADEADRRIKDSYWRCIGVPGFTSYAANDTWENFNWNADTENMPYLYEWHMDDNKLSVVSSSTFTFKSMHAYLIQNGNSFTWSSVAVPSASSVVARRQAPASEDSYYEFYLEMQNGEKALDHTYVRLTDNESVTTDFDFGQDLSKELNSGANIFTKVGYERLAANNLPLSEQTTIVPVGVKIVEEGNYTFSMPEGTHGVGVTLVDNETGDRTNLSLFDYSVNLTKGDYANRFILEISPVKQMPTDIENVQGNNVQGAKARKVMIDGILYIVKDGKVFDARGAKVK